MHYAFIFQGVKYQNPVSLWNKLNKISEDKDGMLEKGLISYRPRGYNSNCSGLSAPLSLMSKANYFVEISYSLNIVCMTVAACEAFTL